MSDDTPNDRDRADQAIFEHVMRRINPHRRLLLALWEATHSQDVDAWASQASAQLRDALREYPRNPYMTTTPRQGEPMALVFNMDFVQWFAKRYCEDCGLDQRWPARLLSLYWQDLPGLEPGTTE